ncbi:type IV secretory system conjugative DNA transfer family protein, partial [Brevundimonas sp.]|uniref:type IV secretory system conjugative DNA transfer family protein n=1 Tax=Brevundimonas sp. TaxID=1871086 RepID=UPI00391A6BF2
MTRKILTLLGVMVLVMTMSVSARAQESREWLTNAIASQQIDIAVIEAERRRDGVPADFADRILQGARGRARDWGTQADAMGQGASVRRDAAQQARRVLTSSRRTPYLSGFPDPSRVRSDIARTSAGERDVIILGRQAGRFMMLYRALERLSAFHPEDRPPDVRRMQSLYVAYYHDLVDRAQLEEIRTCPRVGPCRRRDFYEAAGDFEYGEARAAEAAQLYLPPAIREPFVDLTGSTGSRTQHAAEIAAARAKKAAEKSDFDLSWMLSLLGWAITPLLLCGLFLFFIFVVLKSLSPAKPAKPSGNFGTADYAPFRSIMTEPRGLTQGVYLGMSAYPGLGGVVRGAPVLSTPETHTLIVAPSGTGKGRTVIVPTLLLYQSSIIVIDPKGENAAITARFRRDHLHQSVHIINPWGVLAENYAAAGFTAATFNPLDLLRADDPNVVSIARSMAEKIAINGPAPDPYWQRTAASMLTALLLWVTDKGGPDKTLGGIADLLSGGEKMEDLRETLFKDMAASTAYDGAMRKQIAQFMTMGDRQYGSVISQLADALQFAADPLLVRATNTSSFPFSSIVDGKTSVFIVIPDEQMQPQAAWLRLLLAAVTETFKRERPAAKGIRGLFLIDEFPALGPVDRFVRDIAVMRGAGLDYTIAIQSLSQLRDTYGTAADTLIGNCRWKWFCNVNDLATAEYLSRAIGQMTVQTVSRTVSAGQGGEGRSFGETGRARLFP